MITVIGKVTATKRVGTSTMGNPTYDVTLEHVDGSHGIYRTMSNTMLAYAIENSNYREDNHVFTLTRAGRLRSAKPLA